MEEAQRQATKLRSLNTETWTPRCFEFDSLTESWQYRSADVRPWDLRNDLVQYENNFVIATKTRHRTPMIRAASIKSVGDRNSDALRHRMVGLTSVDSHNRTRKSPRDPIPSSGSAPEFRLGSRSSAIVLPKSNVRSGDGSVSSSADGEHLHSSEEDSRRLTDSQRSKTHEIRSVVKILYS